MSDPPGAVLFWRLVEPLLESGEVVRGTIMGRPCVRSDGEFVAMPHSQTGALVVKLEGERVVELVKGRDAEPFAPAGRVFQEWLVVSRPDEAFWQQLLAEALARAKDA